MHYTKIIKVFVFCYAHSKKTTLSNQIYFAISLINMEEIKTYIEKKNRLCLFAFNCYKELISHYISNIDSKSVSSE